MNTSSPTCKGRVRKTSKVRKNGQIIGPEVFGAAQMAQHTKCARKGERKGRERDSLAPDPFFIFLFFLFLVFFFEGTQHLYSL